MLITRLNCTHLISENECSDRAVLLDYLISCVHVIHIPFLMDWLAGSSGHVNHPIYYGIDVGIK